MKMNIDLSKYIKTKGYNLYSEVQEVWKKKNILKNIFSDLYMLGT